MNSKKRLKKKGEYSGYRISKGYPISFIIVIVGPTASGKSEAAVRLARKFNGEVISADSRQVYRGLDIGTGKVPNEIPKIRDARCKQISNSKEYFYKNVQHHLIDVASPRRQFSAARFQNLGQKALRDILRRGKTPIIAGGTGFYIDALLSPNLIPAISPRRELWRELEKKSLEELYAELQGLAPERAAIIDRKNKRRLIRAIEIARSDNFTKSDFVKFTKSDFVVVKIGLLVPKEELKGRIRERFMEWVKRGFLEEVQNLRKSPSAGGQGLSWKRIENFGLNYRAAAEYLQGEISYEQMIEKSVSEIYKYAKRQMTWFRRDKEIRWLKCKKV